LFPEPTSFTISVADGEGLTANDIVNLQVREEDPLVKTRQKPSRPMAKAIPVPKTWHINNADLLDECTVEVFNRQGQRVFSTTGYATEWNGTFNGSLLPQGVYFYVIRCSDKKPNKGSVTLIR
jgi:gliding motility-associated-like protein